MQPQASHSPRESPYWNPYLAGVALGLVLLATYVIFGRGLGASGALTRFAAWLAHGVAPDFIEHNGHVGSYFAPGTAWWDDWLIFEMVGVALGGLFSGLTAGRVRLGIDRGPRISDRARLGFALIGGVIVGFAARLALGCTSGQALSGGATLALGSWVFTATVFVGAYLTAIVARRLWT